FSSAPIDPTSIFSTFEGPSPNLGPEISQPFSPNPTTNSFNQIPQYGNIAHSADSFNNPENLHGPPGGTVDPRLLWAQPTQSTFTYAHESTNLDMSAEYHNIQGNFGWSYNFGHGS